MNYSEIYLKENCPVFWALWKESGVTPDEIVGYRRKLSGNKDRIHFGCLLTKTVQEDEAADAASRLAGVIRKKL